MAKSQARARASRKAALKRIGQTKPTGNFDKIANEAAKEYGSKEAGKRVAAAIYWKKARKFKGKKGGNPFASGVKGSR